MNRRTVLTTTIVLIGSVGLSGDRTPGVWLQLPSPVLRTSTDNVAVVTAAPVVDNRPPSGAQPVGLGLGGRKEAEY